MISGVFIPDSIRRPINPFGLLKFSLIDIVFLL